MPANAAHSSGGLLLLEEVSSPPVA
eukprot:COSAG01_NODE_58652_length_304_cov_3.458537_1_plen_24_part_10